MNTTLDKHIHSRENINLNYTFLFSGLLSLLFLKYLNVDTVSDQLSICLTVHLKQFQLSLGREFEHQVLLDGVSWANDIFYVKL